MIALLLALTAADADMQLDLERRREAAIVVLTPFGMSQENSVSRIIDEAVTTFTERTNLRLRPAAQAGIDEAQLRECPAERRTACWIARAREAPIVLVLIVTVAGGEGGDEVAMLAVDIASGERAVVEPRVLSPSIFASLVDGPLKPLLESLDAFRAFGAVAVETDCVDCALRVDGRPPIDVGAGRITVRGLDSGRHEVALFRADEAVCTHDVSVTATQTRALDCTGFPPDDPGSRVATYVAGGAISAIGVAMVAWTIATAGATSRVCVHADPSMCDFGPSPRPGEPRDGVVLYEAGTIPFGPLGAGLAAGGLTAIATSWLFDRAPWWAAALAGLVGGTVISGIALAVD